MQIITGILKQKQTDCNYKHNQCNNLERADSAKVCVQTAGETETKLLPGPVHLLKDIDVVKLFLITTV